MFRIYLFCSTCGLSIYTILIIIYNCIYSFLPIHLLYKFIYFYKNIIFFCFSVPPEPPLVLNRWGRQLNGTILGPMEEGDDIMLTCRVVGGKWFFFLVYKSKIKSQADLKIDISIITDLVRFYDFVL